MASTGNEALVLDWFLFQPGFTVAFVTEHTRVTGKHSNRLIIIPIIETKIMI